MLLQGLPVEILGRIFHVAINPRSRFGTGRVDALKNIRLTCKQFAAIGTASLFETASLYPEEGEFQSSDEEDSLGESDQEKSLDESNPLTSASKFCRLQNNTEIRDKIRTIILNTSVDGEESSERSDTLSDAWRDAVSGIGKFPNLSSVHIRFRKACSDEKNFYNWVTENRKFRAEVMKTVFAALNSREHLTPNLRSLSINNLQNLTSPGVTQSPDFKAVLSRLTELHLNITRENEDASPECNISHDALHSFFREELPNVWLKPVAAQLTHLTLYCRTYWGWAPAFDPRKLHFPKLKYLVLGNYTFAHDWQSDWITTLGPTLETLILDDCPILFYIWPADSLRKHVSSVSHEDHIKYLIRENDPGDRSDDNHYTYLTRWHTLFPKLETGLPALTKFVYTHGEWPDAFDTRNEMLPYLDRNRYVAFNGGIGPSQWEELPEPKLKSYLASNSGNQDLKFEKLLRKQEETYESFGSTGWDEVELKTPAAKEPPCKLIATADGPVNEDGDGSGDESIEIGSQDTDEGDEGESGCQGEDEKAFYALLGTVARRARMRGHLEL